MKAVQILGFCGLVSSGMVSIGSFVGSGVTVGIGALVMVVGNVFAMLWDRPNV